MSGEVRQRYMQANYIDVGSTDSTYAFMGAGFSELNESPSAQTSSKRYINDKAQTKRVTGYDWSSSFNTDQIRSEEVVYEGKHISVRASVGVASYPQTCANPGELLTRADWAMYHSKKNGRDRITIDSEKISSQM